MNDDKPHRLPQPKRRDYFFAQMMADNDGEVNFAPPDPVVNIIEGLVVIQYTKEAIQWFMDAARATLRRQIISQALKQHYAPLDQQPQHKDEIAKAVANGSAYSINMSYPTRWFCVAGSDHGTSGDEDDYYIDNRQELEKKFDEFSRKKYPCIPFLLLLRCQRVYGGNVDVIYDAPFAAVASGSQKNIHIMMHALILSGFLTFTILPSHTGEGCAYYYPLGMLVWHYLANRAGLIPDFDLEGVKDIINNQSQTQGKFNPHNFSRMQDHMPLLDHPTVGLISPENVSDCDKNGDRIDFQQVHNFPLVGQRLYDTFITKRTLHTTQQRKYQQQEQQQQLANSQLSLSISTGESNNNSMVNVARSIDDNWATQKIIDDTTQSTLPYNHTEHCYLLYSILEESNGKQRVDLDALTKLLTKPKAETQEDIEFNNKIKLWCLNELCTAYGSLSQSRQAMYDFISDTNHDSMYDFLSDTNHGYDKGPRWIRSYCFNNIYSICFVLNIIELIENTAVKSRQSMVDDGDNDDNNNGLSNISVKEKTKISTSTTSTNTMLEKEEQQEQELITSSTLDNDLNYLQPEDYALQDGEYEYGDDDPLEQTTDNDCQYDEEIHEDNETSGIEQQQHQQYDNTMSPFLFSSIYSESPVITFQDFIYHRSLSLKVPYVIDKNMESQPQLYTGPSYQPQLYTSPSYNSFQIDPDIAKYINEYGPLCFLPLAQQLCTILCNSIAVYDNPNAHWRDNTNSVLKYLDQILNPEITKELSNYFDLNQIFQGLLNLFYTPDTPLNGDYFFSAFQNYFTIQNSSLLVPLPIVVQYFNQHLLEAINNVQIPTDNNITTTNNDNNSSSINNTNNNNQNFILFLSSMNVTIDNNNNNKTPAIRGWGVCLFAINQLLMFQQSYFTHIAIDYNIILQLLDLVKSLIQYASCHATVPLEKLGLQGLQKVLPLLRDLIHTNVICHINKTSRLLILKNNNNFENNNNKHADDVIVNDNGNGNVINNDDGSDDGNIYIINHDCLNEFDILSFPLTTTCIIDDDYNNNIPDSDEFTCQHHMNHNKNNISNNNNNDCYDGYCYENEYINYNRWITLWNDFLVFLTQDIMLTPLLTRGSRSIIDLYLMDNIMPVLTDAIKYDVETLYKGIHQYKVNNIKITSPHNDQDITTSSTTTTSYDKQNDNNIIIPLISSTTKLTIIKWINNLFHLCNINSNSNIQTLNLQQQQQTYTHFSKEQLTKISQVFQKQITSQNYHIQISLCFLQLYILYQHIFINLKYPPYQRQLQQQEKEQHGNHNQRGALPFFNIDIEQNIIIIETFKLMQQKIINNNSSNKNNTTSLSLLFHLDDIQLSYVIDYFVYTYNSTNSINGNNTNTKNLKLTHQSLTCVDSFHQHNIQRSCQEFDIVQYHSLYQAQHVHFNNLYNLLLLHIKYSPYGRGRNNTNDNNIDNDLQFTINQENNSDTLPLPLSSQSLTTTPNTIKSSSNINHIALQPFINYPSLNLIKQTLQKFLIDLIDIVLPGRDRGCNVYSTEKQTPHKYNLLYQPQLCQLFIQIFKTLITTPELFSRTRTISHHQQEQSVECKNDSNNNINQQQQQKQQQQEEEQIQHNCIALLRFIILDIILSLLSFTKVPVDCHGYTRNRFNDNSKSSDILTILFIKHGLLEFIYSILNDYVYFNPVATHNDNNENTNGDIVNIINVSIVVNMTKLFTHHIINYQKLLTSDIYIQSKLFGYSLYNSNNSLPPPSLSFLSTQTTITNLFFAFSKLIEINNKLLLKTTIVDNTNYRHIFINYTPLLLNLLFERIISLFLVYYDTQILFDDNNDNDNSKSPQQSININTIASLLSIIKLIYLADNRYNVDGGHQDGMYEDGESNSINSNKRTVIALGIYPSEVSKVLQSLSSLKTISNSYKLSELFKINNDNNNNNGKQHNRQPPLHFMIRSKTKTKHEICKLLFTTFLGNIDLLVNNHNSSNFNIDDHDVNATSSIPLLFASILTKKFTTTQEISNKIKNDIAPHFIFRTLISQYPDDKHLNNIFISDL